MRAPRILLVEDEPSIAEPFARRCEREGFAPTVARTAREALQLADELEPDLVLLDLGAARRRRARRLPRAARAAPTCRSSC